MLARLSGKCLFTVAEIASCLARRGKRALRPEDVSRQFDTEDGSDRREWLGAGRWDGEIADADLRAEVKRAHSVLHDVEFLLAVSADAAVRGQVDCLWEDAHGGRHVLTVTSGERAAKGRRAKPEDWPLGLVLAAVALYRQTGTWPRTVTAYNVTTGTVRRGDGDQLPHAAALTAVSGAVNELRRETLPA